jgi:hypothetical protein
MNIRVITVVIFLVIILGGLGVFFMNEKNTQELTERITPTVSSETISDAPGPFTAHAQTGYSMGQRVSFQYPGDWELRETTIKGGRGEFGTILQSWVLQSFPMEPEGQGGIPNNSAKIDIEIQNGGGNHPLDDLLDCDMKTTSCEKIGIDNEQFIKTESTLNTGMKTVSVATFFDDKILRANALIAPGTDEAALTSTVNAILQSFKFSDTSGNR